MRNVINLKIWAAVCMVISFAMICPAHFSMVAVAQQLPDQGGYGGSYGVASDSYSGDLAAQLGDPVSFITIQGLEGLQGFTPGQNRLSLAAIPISKQDDQMGFQVIGFAISSPNSGTATVYSFSRPLPGVIDPSQNTLQVDLSGLDSAIQDAGFIDSSQVYDTIRSDPKVIVIDIDMTYQGSQGSQTIFNANAVDIIPPDGNMQAFSLQQTTQLIIDSQSMRIFMVAIPQVANTFSMYYSASFSQVLPVVYAQPVPVYPPIFVPYLTPFPIFFSTYSGYNSFFFGGGFWSFFNYGRFGGYFPIHDRNFGRGDFNNFWRGRIDHGGIRPGDGQGRPGLGDGQFRPGGGNQLRPGGGDGQGRPGLGDGQFRPGGGNQLRPGGGDGQGRPGLGDGQFRPGGGNQLRPGGGDGQGRPGLGDGQVGSGGGSQIRPGGGGGNQIRSGGSGQVGSGGGSQIRPGGGGGNQIRSGGSGQVGSGGGSQIRPGGGGGNQIRSGSGGDNQIRSGSGGQVGSGGGARRGGRR